MWSIEGSSSAGGRLKRVRGQKVTRKNVFAGANGRLKRVRGQKVTRKNVFAGANGRLKRVRGQKVTRKNVFAGANGRLKRVRGQKVTRKNVFAGADKPPTQEQVFAYWLVDTLPGLGAGGGSEAKKKFCVPQIDLQFRAPLISFIFFPKEQYPDVGGWVGQPKSRGASLIPPPSPQYH